MNLYESSPHGWAIQLLIHDTNSAIGKMSYHLDILSRWLKEHHKILREKGETISSDPYIAIEYLKSDQKEFTDALDVYYEKLKNDFKKPE